MKTKYLQLDDLIKFCEGKGIVIDVKSAKTTEEAKVILENYLDNNIKVGKPTIEKYLKLPDSPSSITSEITLDELKKLCKGKSIINDIKACESVAETRNIIMNHLNINTKVDDTTIEEYWDLLNKSEESTNNNEVISSNTIVEKEAILISNAKAEDYESLAKENTHYKGTIKALESDLENLKAQFSKYINSQQEDEPQKKNKLSTTIQSLNELINSNNEQVTVQINKELLSKVTKYVDANSLIKLESIVRESYDLNSTIIQSILLAFIHQNSLL